MPPPGPSHPQRNAPLPVDDVLSQIVTLIQRDRNVAVLAPTGAGKTTRVPPALLDAGVAGERRIVMLQPRRLAAVTAASRMAAERGQRVGQTIGYQVRFDRQTSDATRVLVVTEGIFLQMLGDDPLLETVGAVIFDEFHERRLDSDLALAITRRLQTELRDDLRLAVMSATFDPQPIADYLHCGVVRVSGRSFPVEVRYAPRPAREPIALSAAAGVDAVWDQTAGDLLVFLPGVGEIRQTARRLADRIGTLGAELHELYADLPTDAQQRALAPASRRKIVLTTNVAETSVTIEGITAVVDTGWARVPTFDARVGLNRLDLRRISIASANQRTGRAGRTQPGVCVRLWSETQQRQWDEHLPPEIARLELSSAVLHLLAWDDVPLEAFPWFEPPPAHALDRAHGLLRELGAIGGATGGGVRLTPLGRRLARLPAEPRVGRLLIEAEHLGCLDQAALAAALLSERDPFLRPSTVSTPRADTPSDVGTGWKRCSDSAPGASWIHRWGDLTGAPPKPSCAWPSNCAERPGRARNSRLARPANLWAGPCWPRFRIGWRGAASRVAGERS
jgi:ATP-dependent helicase HrpB